MSSKKASASPNGKGLPLGTESENITVRLPNDEADAIERIAKERGVSLDQIAQEVLGRFVANRVPSSAMEFLLFGERGFDLAVDCTDGGHSAAGHVDRFLDCIRAQVRGLWFLLDSRDGVDPDDNTNGLDRQDLRNYVTGIELLVGLSKSMLGTSTELSRRKSA